ncbi:MAG TPA: UDP-N-acetylmuramate dehydrogenase [Candidatus Bathyarchaeia archaeon]|nr:UDP-N-acetylmuramate dehydrogenase [Candidatus Bathyarchaeia archaeon]
MDKELVQEIRENVAGEVLPGEPLKRHTTYRVGGRAELLVCPRDAEDAARVYSFVKRAGIPFVVIGAGSNVIAPDSGIAGVVLKTAAASARISFPGGGRVRADAGVPLLDLVRKTAARGLVGLEPLAGIPGTVGGAVVMNAGTREVETAQFLSRVEVLTSSGRKRVFSAAECCFGYRRSVFLGTDWFILGAEFRLGRGRAARSAELIEAFLEERERKYPLGLPSAGSVFRRPPGDYAGRLIQEAGCKGMRVGDAEVSELHANFIVNRGHAKASDIMELVSAVRSRVFEKSGVYLELEQIPLSPARSG